VRKDTKFISELTKNKNARLQKIYEQELRHIEQAIHSCEEALSGLRKHRLNIMARFRMHKRRGHTATPPETPQELI